MCALTKDERSLHTSEQHKLTERFITPGTLACIDLACKNWYDTISTNAVTHPPPPPSPFAFCDSFESLSKYIMNNGTLKIEIIWYNLWYELARKYFRIALQFS